MFFVFQSTALVVRGPATNGEMFAISLDRVAIPDGQMRDDLLCVQDFVKNSYFTQRSFFSESCLTMLFEPVAIVGSVTSSPVYAPWSYVETVCAGQVVTDLRAGWDQVSLCGRTAMNTSGRWYHGGTRRSETLSNPGVRNSDILEEGRVDHVPVVSPALGPPGHRNYRASLDKRMVKAYRCPVKLPRKCEIAIFPCNASEEPLGGGSEFFIRSGSAAFSWEVAPKWYGFSGFALE